MPALPRDSASRVLRAGVTTSVIDGLFSSVLVVAAYGSSVRRLFQGVAAVPLGNGAFDGGWRTASIGMLMHVAVAFTWSAVFLMLYQRSSWLRARVASPVGVVAVAAVFGPLVWIVMSGAIIPLFTHRPPAITFRWWVQFVGHVPFVALPIVASIARGRAAPAARDTASPA